MTRRTLLPLLLLAAAGCKNETTLVEADGPYSLVFTLESPATEAGRDVGYLAYMDGMASPMSVEPVLSSDVEDLLDYSSGVLTPYIAGDHQITAVAEWEGEFYMSTVPLEVSPGASVALDLDLSDVAMDAGEEISYEVFTIDKWGNVAEAVGYEVSTDSADVELSGDTGSGGVLTSTVPGLYTATASLEGLTDDEQFVVEAAGAAVLDLQLSDTELELDETTVATVSIYDVYGNEILDDWYLWVEPAEDVELNYNVLTFLAEGEYTVWASDMSGVLTDSVGPLLIDSTGPDITIEDPTRGTQTTEEGQYVTGTATEEYSGIDSIVVNGEPATLSGDSWSAWTDYSFGINQLETVAIDGDNNVTTDVRAVLSGDYTPYGDGIGDGITARVSESGFDTIEDLAVDFIDTDALLDSIPSPVLSEYEETCWNILGWEECIEWYSFYFYIQNASIGDTWIDIDPEPGYLDTGAGVDDFYMGLYAYGAIIGIDYSISGSVAADAVDVYMDLTPSVSSNTLSVALTNTDVEMTGFELDNSFYDVIEEVLSWFSIDLNALLADLIEGIVEGMVEDEVPGLIEDVLADLEISVPLDILGNTYTLDALPYSVSVDEYGLTLGLETWFTSAWNSIFSANPGSLTYPYSPPVYGSSSAGLALGLSEDFINQLFHGLWGAGLLDMELDVAELGLDMEDLSTFLPGMTAMTIGTQAYLPPVVLPGTGGSLLDMQIGDLELSIYNGTADEANLWMRVYVHANVGLDLSATADNTLSAGLGDMELAFDLVYPNDRSSGAQDTELLLETIIPLLLPSLTEALGEIPIPDISGFTLDNFNIALDGAESGYVSIEGDLVSTE